MLKSKNLLDCTNLFSPNKYEKNDKIILKFFHQLKTYDKKIFELFVVNMENYKS